MFPLCHNRLKERRLGRVCMGVAMLLCLVVVVHMLGVPVTLLDPIEAADVLGASALEGFSVPPTVPQLALSSETVPVTADQPSIHVPVLASTLFHPPLR